MVSPTIYQDGCPTISNGHATGHNVVWLGCNGDTTQYPAGATETAETIPGYAAVPGMTFVRSDLRSAYSANPSSVPWAQRDLLFTDEPGEPAMMFVTDNLNVGQSEDFCWSMHTDAGNVVAPIGHNFVIAAPSGAEMVGSTVANGVQPDVLVQPYPVGLYTTYDQPFAQTILKTSVTAPQLDELVAMAVTPSGAAASPIAGPVSGGNVATVALTNGGAPVVVVLAASHGSSTVSDGSGSVLQGSFGKVSLGKGASILDQGSSLVVYGVTYISVTGGTATVAVSGDQVVSTGSGTASCSVFAPQTIDTVTANGASATFTRSGSYIDFTC